MFGGRYYTINLLTCEKARGTNILNLSLSLSVNCMNICPRSLLLIHTHIRNFQMMYVINQLYAVNSIQWTVNVTYAPTPPYEGSFC